MHHSDWRPVTLRRPVTANVKAAKRIRKAVAASIGRQRATAGAQDSPRITIGENGARRSVGVHLPPDLASALPDGDDPGDVLAPLPRRKPVEVMPTDNLGVLPGQKAEPIRVNLLRVFGRWLAWNRAIAAFFLGTAWDAARRRDSQERRAVRLREIFERAGGTLIKVGQQMSIRLDILPIRYCEELALMLDQVPPFPTEDAIIVIERATGKKLEEVFSAFDPEPIGSASIACVYQAVLRETGEKVAVKVRRPGIWKVFEADFRVLELVTKLSEWFTLLRPGYAENFRKEFRAVLSSELDFRREARYQELFRRRARKSGKRFFTAPRVLAEYSTDEVLVMEFVSGMWLSEVLTAVEQGEESAVARMKELNINPKTLAHRLLYTHNWGLYEHLAFHADPHPANIVVRANNELVFIDFGACGHINRVRREMFARVYGSYAHEDTWTMAQLSVNASEPLPPMDINSIARETEAAYHDFVLMIKSKRTFWYERTSAHMWLTMLQIVGKYNVPAPIDVLMYARSTLLYDTLAARLWPRINYFKEYELYGRDARRKARKRARRTLRERLLSGPTGADFETFEKVGLTVNTLLYRVQRLFAAPYDFTVVSFTVEKWIFIVMTVIRFLVRSALLTAAGMALVAVSQALTGEGVVLADGLREVMNSGWYHLGVVLLALIHLRMILYRLGEKIKQE